MESLVYFVIIAFFLVAALVVAAFGALGFGAIGLVVALVVALAMQPGTKALLRLCGISASMAIVGTLLLLLIGGRTLLLAYYVHPNNLVTAAPSGSQVPGALCSRRLQAHHNGVPGWDLRGNAYKARR